MGVEAGFFIARSRRIVNHHRKSKRYARRFPCFGEKTQDKTILNCFIRRFPRPPPSVARLNPSPKTKKDTRWVSFVFGAEAGFEPRDLRVMSPTSYQAALLRDIREPQNSSYSFRGPLCWCRQPDSNRHGNFFPTDFKSVASTDSATSAYLPNKYITQKITCQVLFSEILFRQIIQ